MSPLQLARAVWVWEESWVFSTSRHFPSELGFHFLPQFSVLPFVGRPGLETASPVPLERQGIETDCSGRPFAMPSGQATQEPEGTETAAGSFRGRCPGVWCEEPDAGRPGNLAPSRGWGESVASTLPGTPLAPQRTSPGLTSLPLPVLPQSSASRQGSQLSSGRGLALLLGISGPPPPRA